MTERRETNHLTGIKKASTTLSETERLKLIEFLLLEALGLRFAVASYSESVLALQAKYFALTLQQKISLYYDAFAGDAGADRTQLLAEIRALEPVDRSQVLDWLAFRIGPDAVVAHYYQREREEADALALAQEGSNWKAGPDEDNPWLDEDGDPIDY